MKEYHGSPLVRGFSDNQMGNLDRNFRSYLRSHPAATKDDIDAKGYMGVVARLYKNSIRVAKEAVGVPKKYYTPQKKKKSPTLRVRTKTVLREFPKRGNVSRGRYSHR